MDIGTAKPTPAERAEVPHHLIDIADPWDEFTVAWFAAEARRRGRRHRRPGPASPARRRHRPVPAGPWSTTCRCRAGSPRCGPRSRPSPTPSPSTTGSRRSTRSAAGAHGADEPAAGRAGPRGHARQRPAVLVLRARASRPTRRAASTWSACALPHEVVADRIEARYRRQMDDGFLDEVERLARRPARACRARPARRSATASCAAHVDGGRAARRGARPGGPPDPAVRPPAGVLVPPRPPHPLARRRRRPGDPARRAGRPGGGAPEESGTHTIGGRAD